MMRNRSTPASFFTLLFFFFVSASQASDPPQTAESLLEKVTHASASISSLSSRFTQTKNLSLFTSPIVFQGKLAVIRPDKLRWQFTSPVPSSLIFNGDNGLRCTEGSPEQRFSLRSDPVMKIVAEQLWSWLDGDYSDLDKEYGVVLKDPYTLEITPLQPGAAEVLRFITLGFNSENLQPETVIIAEQSGDETRLDFYAYSVDPILPHDLFTHCETRDW